MVEEQKNQVCLATLCRWKQCTYAPMIAMRAMKLDFVDRVVPRMRRVGVA